MQALVFPLKIGYFCDPKLLREYYIKRNEKIFNSVIAKKRNGDKFENF